MRERIGIRTQTDAPEGASGSGIVYGDALFVWAKVQPVGGALYFGSQQIEQSVTHRFFIRTLPNVTAQHVIEWNNTRFRVRRVTALGDAKQFTVIEAEELGRVA